MARVERAPRVPLRRAPRAAVAPLATGGLATGDATAAAAPIHPCPSAPLPPPPLPSPARLAGRAQVRMRRRSLVSRSSVELWRAGVRAPGAHAASRDVFGGEAYIPGLDACPVCDLRRIFHADAPTVVEAFVAAGPRHDAVGPRGNTPSPVPAPAWTPGTPAAAGEGGGRARRARGGGAREILRAADVLWATLCDCLPAAAADAQVAAFVNAHLVARVNLHMLELRSRAKRAARLPAGVLEDEGHAARRHAGSPWAPPPLPPLAALEELRIPPLPAGAVAHHYAHHFDAALVPHATIDDARRYAVWFAADPARLPVT